MKFLDICNYLNQLQITKGRSYGSMDLGEQESWNREGEVGAYFTVKRKLDRLDKAVKDAIKNGHIDDNLVISDEGRQGEPLLETLVDAAVYFVKWVQWYANTVSPKQFEDWLKNTLSQEQFEDWLKNNKISGETTTTLKNSAKGKNPYNHAHE